MKIFKIAIDQYKFDRKRFKSIILMDPTFLIFKSTQINNIISTLRRYNLKSEEIANIILDYPDLLLNNRYSILQKKFALFDNLKLEKSTIRNMIRHFPFLLLKSYNSYIRKIEYFKTQNLNILEAEIFPLIFCYNLKTEIKPRMELMRQKNRFLPLKQAFSMSDSEFVKIIDSNIEEYQSLAKPSAPLYERDLTFRYNKYITI